MSPSYSNEPDSINFDFVDKYALQSPKTQAETVEKLTKYLVTPYENDILKARSIYVWIVNNISYDHKMANDITKKPETIQSILKTKNAICGGYSELFKKMAELAGIRAVYIAGYSRHHSFREKKPFSWSSHAWNAIEVGGVWYLLDSTWEREIYSKLGKSIGKTYFLKTPKEFILDHLPEDPMWQLLYHPITLQEYKKSLENVKELLLREDTCYHYLDSINSINKLAPPEARLKTAMNAFIFNPSNHLAIGMGMLEFGNIISRNNAKSRKTNINYRILKQKEALNYFKASLSHLNKDGNQVFIESCRSNIKYSNRFISNLNKKKKKLSKNKKH